MKLATLFSSRNAALGVVLGCLWGCADDSHVSGVGSGGAPRGQAPIGDGCSTPREGCPCTTETLEVKCGETVSRDANTLTCREGTRTCGDGKWGACVGDATSEMYSPAPAAPGVETQGLAAAPMDCLDKCDPYCQKLADTPDDLVVDPELVADPTGLTLFANGYTGSNCPDVRVTPSPTTLTITAINADGSVPPPNSVPLTAGCGAAATPITPSWSTDQPDRSAVDLLGTLQVFSGIAGDINVTANSLLDTGTSLVTVKVDINDVADVPDAAIQAVFAGAGSEADPGKTLYPYKGTVFPLDLKAPLVQWKAEGVAAANVQVALRYPANSTTPLFWYSKLFADEPNEGTLQATGAPSWQIPQAVWTAFSRTAKGANAEIIIQRRTASTLYEEMKIPVTFATAALRGTVYYTQYLKRVFKPGAAELCGGQTDLPTTYSPVAPSGAACPVGNCTHADDVFGGSTTRAIDMSNPLAANLDPFNGAGGCPVCHSVSANGNVYVSGSKFLQSWGTPAGSSTGFVNSIGADAVTGLAKFTVVGEAPNYSQFRTAGDWDSRGFGYAALTPDGALALQGFYSWGNTQDGTVADNLTVDRALKSGGKPVPMFFVPTAVNGANVMYATTAALAATRAGNVLTASAGALPTIDGVTLSVGDSLLVKDQATASDNGIYVVSDLGSGMAGSTELTLANNLPTLSSSDFVAGSPASNAFDNNGASRWESDWSDPQWLQVDLGSSKTITRIRIEWERANAQNYTIQVSPDAVTWTTISTQTNLAAGDNRIDDFTVTGTGRFVRMNGTARTTEYGHSIWEMDVYGPGPGTPYKLTRRVDAQTPATAQGTIKADWEVRVSRGTANYAKVFRLTAPATDPTINTDSLVFADTGADPLPVMMTPTISKDGTKLAYVNGDQDTIGADSTAWRKGLTMVDLDPATRKISNKKRILSNWDAVTGGAPVKWPFFEHDSHSLLYVESNTDNYCRSESSANDPGRACRESIFGNSAPTSRGYWPGSLYSIDTAATPPSSTRVELAKLNDAEDAADADKAYQPTVLPFSNGGFRWAIFTSPRSYGNQLNQIGTNFTCGATMLWVAAIDDTDANGTDRSHPAFFLPGQNALPITTPEHYVNERGYLVPSPCKTSNLSCTTSDECCAGSQCRVDSISATGTPNKVCKDPASCSAVGAACITSADCCGASPCTAQKCEAIPSYPTPVTYTRDYSAACPPGFQPRWGLFLFHLTTASSSRIGFAAQTAATAADLATAMSVSLGDSSQDNYEGMPDSRDVGDALEAAQQPFARAHLRVSMTLYPSANGLAAPILHDWEQRYSCEPAE